MTPKRFEQSNQNRRKQTLLVIALLAVTVTAGLGARSAAWLLPGDIASDSSTPVLDFVAAGSGPVHFTGQLDRGAVLEGSDGRVKLELVIRGDDLASKARAGRVPTDLVVVLDRSGSMKGQALYNARAAIRELMRKLGDSDRFGLVSYASDATLAIPLEPASAAARQRWDAIVDGISAQGGTNMAGGLDLASHLVDQPRRSGRTLRMILISDGHANEGDVSIEGLRNRARRAVQGEYVLSTAGVGEGFDEGLMTALADSGTGNFYYVARSDELGGVFSREFASAREKLASSLAVRIEPRAGIEVVDVAGYPLEHNQREVVFRPGDLAAGQERRIWVTLRAPTGTEGPVELAAFRLEFRREGVQHSMALDGIPSVACVAGEEDYYASVDGDSWARSVMVDDYNELKQQVAESLRSGTRTDALSSIRAYAEKKEKANRQLQRKDVARQLRGLDQLEEEVESAFTQGAPQRNRMSKSLVAEARDDRRVGSKQQAK
jgi:Ca-activated chloride channel family protein